MADPYFSDYGVEFLKSAEGTEKEGDLHVSYIDSVGVLTIGYGHTGPDVSKGQTITEERAEQLLRADIKTAETVVRNSVNVELLPNQPPPVSGKLSAALLFLYFSGGRDRKMIWDIHRIARRQC